MRKLALSALALEAYAVFLAWLAGLHGVLTDEAKYLLNVPYPHPPLVRSLWSWLLPWQYQEMFLRMVMATLVVQAVWVVWALGKNLKKPQRLMLCFVWLTSMCVIQWGGSLLLTVPFALFGILFAWWLRHPQKNPGLLGLVWLAALFSSFQNILLLPLVAGIAWRMKLKLHAIILFVGLPLALLALYLLTNPLIVARLVGHVSEGEGALMSSRLWQTAEAWVLGGNLLFSIFGTVSILRSRNIWLMGTALLVLLYVLLNPQSYYALLFLPLFVAGLASFGQKHPFLLHPAFLLTSVFSVIAFQRALSAPAELVSRDTLRSLPQAAGPVLIDGAFGHDWQYYSTTEVLRVTKTLDPKMFLLASAVIQLKPPFVVPSTTEQWTLLSENPVGVWVDSRQPLQ